jgi:chromosome segregation ATPase
MKATILFAATGLLIFMSVGNYSAAYDARQMKIPDDLSNVGIERLGEYVKNIHTRIETYDEQLQEVRRRNQLTKEELKSPGRSYAEKPEYLEKTVSKLNEGKKGIAITDRDLERLRAEILKRLSELKVHDPSLRAQYQDYKRKLIKYKQEVRPISAGYRLEKKVAEANVHSPQLIGLDEPSQ